MPKFRKKPVVIEAIQWTGTNVEEMFHWFEQITSQKITTTIADNVSFEGGGCQVTFDLTQKPNIRLFIRTLEGTHEASHGDWVICGVKS